VHTRVRAVVSGSLSPSRATAGVAAPVLRQMDGPGGVHRRHWYAAVGRLRDENVAQPYTRRSIRYGESQEGACSIGGDNRQRDAADTRENGIVRAYSGSLEAKGRRATSFVLVSAAVAV
jgi:hypothetical protein